MARIFCWLLVTFFWLCQAHEVRSDDNSGINFNRDVKPILSDNCYRCHGPDEGERQTELRLDQQDSAFSLLESDTHAIVPRDVESSELIKRITSDDEDARMPPLETGKQLSADQLDILKRWIASGAEWGEHWSFVAPQRPSFPEIAKQGWGENEIDRFVLAKLENEKWQPSPRADKRTRIRRATLAATGLPPTRDELRAFIEDKSPDAYAKLVDRLLQSPRYGEHQTRYWLDVARYGDTHGMHLDNERSIWRYRDWVIDAFNSNMPFDQFTIEQLAGDLLPNATDDQRIATGFHRCNVTTGEGGAIAEEFLARYAVDRVETTSTVWMGLTTGCAACHDHKFDPISQREFYQLFAYFNNLTEKAMDGNAMLPPPAIKAPTELQRRAQEKLKRKLESLTKKVDQWRANAKLDRSWEHEFAKSFSSATPAPVDSKLHWTFESLEQNAAAKTTGNLETVPGKQGNALTFDGKSWIEHKDDDFAKFNSSDTFSLGAWVKIKNDGANTILSRMHDADNFRGYDLYVAGGKVFVHLISQWQDDAIRVNTKLPIRKDKWHHVFATYDGSSKAEGITIYVDGAAKELEYTHDTLKGSIATKEPFRVGKRKSAALFNGAIDELLVFDRCLKEEEIVALGEGNNLIGILAMNVDDRSETQDSRLIDEYLRTHSKASAAMDAQTAAKKRLSTLEQSFPSTLVMEERKEPRETYLLVRGEYDNKGEQVFPAIPAFLPASNAKAQSRLTLAKWLVSGEHPLTARVTVNRIWQQYFGVGLVKTSEDFGSQGEWPSHPQLLDFLATQLVDNDWDLKAIHRQILMSATFQQSSNLSERAAREDPENRLLSHGPRFRMDAEMIRDFAMSTSRLIVGDVGGPSVKPPQPMGLWNAVGYTSSNTANFKADPPDRRYRRGMYTFWKRTSPPPQMQILDAPSREVCTVRRPRTNTPAAALLLMNDGQFVEAARNLAARLMHEYSDEEARMQAAYDICLARLPDKRELTVLTELLQSSLQSFRDDPTLAGDLVSHGSSVIRELDKTELAAWTMVCSTILNLDETLNQH